MARSLTEPDYCRTEVWTGWVVGRLMQQPLSQSGPLRESRFRPIADIDFSPGFDVGLDPRLTRSRLLWDRANRSSQMKAEPFRSNVPVDGHR
jgi:hypothetical protein